MNNRTLGRLAGYLVITMMLSLMGVVTETTFAKEMTPEVAAKVENHRKQKEQQVTQEKKRVAADALKAERLKVYKAKQLVKKNQNDGKQKHNNGEHPVQQ